MSISVQAISVGHNRVLINYYDYPVIDRVNQKPITVPNAPQLVKVSNWVQSVEVINVKSMQRVELSYEEIDKLVDLINKIKQEQIPPISLDEYYNITA